MAQPMTTNVTVLFFAGTRNITQTERRSVALPSSVVNIADFLEWLTTEYPALLPYVASLRVARNEAFAELSTTISSGDVLALIPPVSGG